MKPRKYSPNSFAIILASFQFLAMLSYASSGGLPPSRVQVQVNTQDYCRSVGRALGRCVPLQECVLFSGWLKQRPVLKQNVKTVVKFTCYFDIKQPKVCCPLHEIENRDQEDGGIPSSYNLIHDHFGEIGASRKKIIPKREEALAERLLFPDELAKTGNPGPEAVSKRDNHVGDSPSSLVQRGPNYHLLPTLEECGSSVKLSRHVGTFGAYPWVAILGNKDPTGNWVHVCSGSLINGKYVLSSANCVKNAKYPITHIRLGEYDLETRVDRGSPYLPNTIFEEFPVQGVIPHPNYDPITGKNDLALVRIYGGSIKYSNYVRPICLPFRDHYALPTHFWGSEEPDFFLEKKLLIAGWGRLHLNSTGYRTLQEASVKITPSDDCEVEGNSFYPGSQSCVGGNSRDNLCLSDAGGALMLPMRIAGQGNSGAVPKVFQIGVYSSGPTASQCQIPSGGTEHRLVFLRHNNYNGNRVRSAANLRDVPRPGVYTKVIPYLEWILEQLQP